MKNSKPDAIDANSTSWFSRQSLAFKIALGVAVTTVAAMTGLTALIVSHDEQSAMDSVKREMAASMDIYEQSLQTVFESAVARGKSMMPVYIKELGGEPRLDGASVDTGEAGLAPLVVSQDGELLNGNVNLQLRIRALTGADTAILVKHNGGWIRVSTLLKDENGNFRIGSRLPDGDHLANTLNAGASHAGLVQRQGRWYALTIHPLKTEHGETFGGLTIRVDVDDDVRRLLNAMTTNKVAKHGAIGIVSKQGGDWAYVAGPRAGQKATAEVSQFLAQANDGKGEGFMPYDLGAERGMNLIAWAEVPDWNWTLYSSGPQDAFMAEANSKRLVVIGIMLGSTLAIIFVAMFLARRTLAPIGEVIAQLTRIGKGDLSKQIPQTPKDSKNEVHQLLHGLNATQDGLSRIVGAMREGAQQIHTGAAEIVAGNADLSSRTEQQAASLEETAASMDELSGTVRQTADNAQQAKTVAVSASEKADRGGKAVGDVVQTMTDISTSSDRITEIVGVIDSIAFQTNILALNAAVEAARAGEQGRGFAVVASEVRALAQRSATAAKEIKTLIEESRQQVQVGADQVSVARAAIEELVSAVQSVSAIMSEISNATNEQSAGIDQVNQAVSQMDTVTQQNASLVEQSAAAAASLEGQSRALTEAVSTFKLRGA